MRKLIFWIRLAIRAPYLIYCARKSRSLPFEERYEYCRNKLDVVTRLLPLQIETIGFNNIPLKNGFLFVGNHQGTLDAFVFLHACSVATTSVSKKEGMHYPVLSDYYKALDFIFFDRKSLHDAVRMSHEVMERLESGQNVLIFPEGTRTKSNQLREFRPGALKGAMRAKAPIVPFALINAYIPLDSNEKIKPIKVVFLQPIHYEEYAEMKSTELVEMISGRIQDCIHQYSD